MILRTILAVAAALAIGACAEAPTSLETDGPDFITYGVTDDGEHPYVGFMLFFDPNERCWMHKHC